MDALRIVGQNMLRGTIKVGGAKNASLPAMAAALLVGGTSELKNAPLLADIKTLGLVLEHLGARVTRQGTTLHIDASDLARTEAPYELVRTMRASILVLGPLVARCGHARVSMPGGCAIGARPVDEHLKGLEALGAKLTLEHGYVEARAPQGGLVGTDITLNIPSVTGTENLMLAAALANGTTRLINAAREPEVVDLALLLRSMGVEVHGAGEDTITIVGQKSIKPFVHTVVPDRIEAGTLLVAGALAGDALKIQGAVFEHQKEVLGQLRAIGAEFHVDADKQAVTISQAEHRAASSFHTAPYPGFPTDMQAQMMVPLALASGRSIVSETIFENRFMHVAELNRLGAQIRISGRNALIDGVCGFSGTTVMATDLRASACLVLAGLVADGETVVRRVYHLDRGYERLEEKLAAAGAKIARFIEA